MQMSIWPKATADFTGTVQHWHVQLVDDETGQTGEAQSTSFDEACQEAINKLLQGLVDRR
jgi:hypothetical protein